MIVHIPIVDYVCVCQMVIFEHCLNVKSQYEISLGIDFAEAREEEE